MKKVLSLSLLGATTSLMAMYGEHAYLYKDPRIMGMGGANVAVGAFSTSVFTNPAGLAKIKEEHGYVVDILGIGFSGSEGAADFLTDLQDAIDTEQDAEVAKVLKEYSGKHFHIGVDNYSSLSHNAGDMAWSVGFLAAADINFVPHAQGSANSSLLETSSRAYGALVVAGAIPYETEIGHIDIGIGLKFISGLSYEGALGISELLDDGEDNDIATTLQNKYERDLSGFGLDIGVVYRPWSDSFWNPSFGVSVMNIGTMSMDDNYGGQPMTVNIGAAVEPDVSFMNRLVIAVDYVDLFNANKVRIYDFSDANKVEYSDYEESDMIKRLRLGASFGLIDTSYFATTLSLGMYQGAYTAGVNLEALLFKLNVTTYEEQVGTGSVDIADRRVMAQIGIGW